MTQHAELIARLEGLSGPCRECDARIAAAVTPGHIAQIETMYTGPGSHDRQNSWMVRGPEGVRRAPHYTASVDAALTLVPEGWYPRLEPRFYSEYDRFEKPCVLFRAYCLKPRFEDASPVRDNWVDCVEFEEGHAVPVIALCIAALKARSLPLDTPHGSEVTDGVEKVGRDGG